MKEKQVAQRVASRFLRELKAAMDPYDFQRDMENLFPDVEYSESEGPDVQRIDFADGGSVWLYFDEGSVEGQMSRRKKSKLESYLRKNGIRSNVEYQ